AAASGPLTSTLPRCDTSHSPAPARACAYSAAVSPKRAGTCQPPSSVKAAPATAATSCSGVRSGMISSRALSNRLKAGRRRAVKRSTRLDDGQGLVGVFQEQARPARVEQPPRAFGAGQGRGEQLLRRLVGQAAQQRDVGVGGGAGPLKHGG